MVSVFAVFQVILGAALVTLVVTGRALVPIRRTFEGQRRFVADASHELRTPATLIHATAQVLDRENLVSPEGRPLVADIAAESERLGRLVGDLLALASTGTAELAMAPERIDLAELTASAVRRAEPRAAAHGIRIDRRRAQVDPDAVRRSPLSATRIGSSSCC